MDEYHDTLRKAASEGSAYAHLPSPSTTHKKDSYFDTAIDDAESGTGAARPLLRLTCPSNDATTAVDNGLIETTRSIPIRTTTCTFAPDCKTPKEHMDPSISPPTPSDSGSSTPRPIITRDQTSQSLSKSWSGLKRTFSGGSSSASSRTRLRPRCLAIRTNSIGDIFNFGRGSRTPTVPNSPHLRSMLKQNEVPDLQSVNKALEQVKAIPGEESNKVVFIDHLTRLAAELTGISDGAKKQLDQAMKARTDGRYEVCRGLCLEIVHNAYSEVPTKVYAYNILSTQATAIQAVRYTDDAAKLAKQHLQDAPEYEKLFGVIAMLRESAIAKLAKQNDRAATAKARAQAQREAARIAGYSTTLADGGLEMPLRPRGSNITLRLPEPAVSAGATSPTTDSVLDRATLGGGQVASMKVASHIGSQADSEEESGRGVVPADGECGVPLNGEAGGSKVESGHESGPEYVGKGKARATE